MLITGWSLHQYVDVAADVSSADTYFLKKQMSLEQMKIHVICTFTHSFGCIIVSLIAWEVEIKSN